MTCKEALAYAVWERQVVQPAAAQLLGLGLQATGKAGRPSGHLSQRRGAFPLAPAP